MPRDVAIAIVVAAIVMTIGSLRVGTTLRSSSMRAILQNNYAGIREELQKNVPSQMISSDGRKPEDWGKSMRKEIMDLHKKKIGWIYSWNVHTRETNTNWLNYGLIFNREPVGLNCSTCPFLMGLLSKIPGLVIAGFSWLRPHTMIDKHTDYLTDTNESVHLGLIVPRSECFLSIYEDDGKVTTFEEKEGRVLRFNSRKPHWAMNFSSEDRIILYLDVETR